MSSSPGTGTFNWPRRVGPLDYYTLPKTTRGDWTARAPLSDDTVLLTLIPGTPPASDAERLMFVSELASLDLKTAAVRTLVQLPAGASAYGPIVVGTMIAWVETSAVDLRAHGWKLHLTDAVSGADRVVARDPGVRAEEVFSVIPAIAFDGSTLLFTVLARREGGAVWELHRLKDGREDTIAHLPEAGTRRFIRVTLDHRSIAWIEAVSQPDTYVNLGVFDLASAEVRGLRTTLSSVYQALLTPERVFLATGVGVMETDRALSYEPKKISPESTPVVPPVSELAMPGSYLLYRNFDVGETLAAIDLSSGSHAVLATKATAGPVHANGVVLFSERPAVNTPQRIGILKG